MNRRERIWLAVYILSFLLSSCGDLRHSIGQIRGTSGGSKDASVDAQAAGQKASAGAGTVGLGGNSGLTEAGTNENEGGLDAFVEASLTDSGLTGPDGGCVTQEFRTGLDIYMMMDSALAFSFEIPAIPGMSTPTLITWAKDEMKRFLALSSNQKIGVGIGFYGRNQSCDSQEYREPDVGIMPVNGTSSTGKTQRQAIEDSFQTINPPPALFEKPALKGATEYAISRYSSSPAFVKQVVFFFQLLFPDMSIYYPGADINPCASVGASTLKESAAYGFQSDPPVQTYVIAANLLGPLGQWTALDGYNETAEAGGTGSAYVTDFTSIDGSLAQKMLTARMAAVTCEFPLPPLTSQNRIDPQLLSLSFSAADLPLQRFENSAGCSTDGGGSDGWYFDDPVTPRKIIHCPATCAKIKSATVPEDTIKITLGCPPSP